jgi:hypothetical protein
VLSDVRWPKSPGSDEVGLVVPWGNILSPAFIRKAGITCAALNCFNRVEVTLIQQHGAYSYDCSADTNVTLTIVVV